LHYSSELRIPTNEKFKVDFKKASGDDADVFAIQGYDAGSLMIEGMKKVKGDTGAHNDLIMAMENSVLDSPRGEISFSKSHNPIQNIYLRKVVNGENEVIGIAEKALADKAAGCSA
jgi:branched-chain amino acid transport system substrate-binding protein